MSAALLNETRSFWFTLLALDWEQTGKCTASLREPARAKSVTFTRSTDRSRRGALRRPRPAAD